MSLDPKTDLSVTELARRVANLVRIGTVSEVDTDAARARIAIGEALTGWLPWMTARAGEDRTWWAPSASEQVMVFAPSGDLAQAVVLPALYGPAGQPPASGAGTHRTEYADGSFVEHNPEQGVVKVHVEGDAVLDVTGDMSVQVGGDLTADVEGAAEVTAGTKATVDAPMIEMNGGTGVVTGQSICHFTGNPHGDISGTVKAGK